MKDKIILELSGNDSHALAEYNLISKELIVLSGAKFSSKISPSFLTHHYFMLRKKIIEKYLDEKYYLTKNVEFSSLSAASSSILGRSSNGHSVWKVRDSDMRIGDYINENSDVLNQSNEEKNRILMDFLEEIEDLDVLKNETKFNVFETLGVVKQEIKHSNFLAWLLDPNGTHKLGQEFLKLFIRDIYLDNKELFNKKNIQSDDIFLLEFDNTKVYREYQNIDILLVDEENKVIVVIENKINSSEHSDQLIRYENTIEKQYGQYKKMYLFLTKEGSESSRPDIWGDYSYEKISHLIEKIAINADDDVKFILEDYKDIIRRKIMKDEKLRELCEKIYFKHKAALDLIYEYRPDIISEIGTFLKNELKSIDEIKESQHNKRIVRFSDMNLRQINSMYKEEVGNWTNDKSIILHEFKINDKNVRMVTVVGPSIDSQSREQLIRHYISKTNDKIKNFKKWTTLLSTNLVKYDENDTPEDVQKKLSENLHKKISKHMEKISVAFSDFEKL